MSDEEYKVAGLSGDNNVFDFNYCNTDRIWRTQLLMTNERYKAGTNYTFDECKNVYVKPKPIASLDILQNLHKKSDYE